MGVRTDPGLFGITVCLQVGWVANIVPTEYEIFGLGYWNEGKEKESHFVSEMKENEISKISQMYLHR